MLMYVYWFFIYSKYNIANACCTMFIIYAPALVNGFHLVHGILINIHTQRLYTHTHTHTHTHMNINIQIATQATTLPTPHMHMHTHTHTHTHTGKNISFVRTLQNEEMESMERTVIASALRDDTIDKEPRSSHGWSDSPHQSL